MCTTTSRVKGGHFTGFIYTVFTQAIELITGRFIKFRSIPQKRGNSTVTGKFTDSAQNSAARSKQRVLNITRWLHLYWYLPLNSSMKARGSTPTTLSHKTKNHRQLSRHNVHREPWPDTPRNTAGHWMTLGWTCPAGSVRSGLRRTLVHTDTWTAKDRRRKFRRWYKGSTGIHLHHHHHHRVPHTSCQWSPIVNNHTYTQVCRPHELLKSYFSMFIFNL